MKITLRISTIADFRHIEIGDGRETITFEITEYGEKEIMKQLEVEEIKNLANHTKITFKELK